ncbi:MAG: substrate-binding domain-containing protein [Prolixibacteraceae bacterium]|nr:substrate-binding domain-containing protein [Prolixibacteraceae bacterium]
MKRFFVFSVVALLLFTACSNSGAKKVKIGFLIHSTSSSRWQMDIAYVQERADEIGANIVLKDAGGDENLQLKQANELLKEGVDALIVVAANQNTAAGIVRDAHQYKVPVIGYDRLIKNSDLDYLVSFEYDKVGQYMVDYAIEKVPHGNYVIVWGDATDANAIFVKNGIEKTLAPHIENGNVNVVFKTYVEGWTYENAKHIVDEVLDFTTEKIDVAIVCNDPMAMGVYAALEGHAYGPNEVIITGQDATLEFVHGMLDGKMSMSVGKPIKELAYGAVDMVVDLVRNNKAKGFDQVVNNGRKDVPAKLYSPYIIDKSNFESELIGKGVFTREQVFRQ